MTRSGAFRLLAITLSLITAAIHLILSTVNLIPDEATVGPLFVAMGMGYVVGAIVIFLKKGFYRLIIFYSAALILAYATSRDALPVEPIGIITKLVEGLLIVLLLLLIRIETRGAIS
ncbi:MAG: hypothetical protein HY619_07150 [Thaumarchaeota archaeon]|nr:hypothetical protein [Nitrososphaerota archaeon]